MAAALKQVDLPRIVFIFRAGVSDRMARKLEKMGIEVQGERVPQETLMKLSEEFEAELDDEDTG